MAAEEFGVLLVDNLLKNVAILKKNRFENFNSLL